MKFTPKHLSFAGNTKLSTFHAVFFRSLHSVYLDLCQSLSLTLVLLLLSLSLSCLSDFTCLLLHIFIPHLLPNIEQLNSHDSGFFSCTSIIRRWEWDPKLGRDGIELNCTFHSSHFWNKLSTKGIEWTRVPSWDIRRLVRWGGRFGRWEWKWERERARSQIKSILSS